MHIAYTLPHRIHRVLTGIRPDVLNDSATSSPSKNIILAMKNTLSKLQALAINNKTGHVNYQQLKNSPSYKEYRQLTTSLQSFDLRTLQSDQQKIAFWINLYNLLAIDAVIHYEIEQTIHECKGVFYRAGYNVGGYFFSLHDIEQGILRINSGHPAIVGAQFAKNDPRVQHIVSKLDPRIHFALVCAAESCPPINTYDAAHIDTQLRLATQHFINSSEVKIDLEKKRANLSKIFQWYAPDFGASFSVTLGFGDASPILRWIAPYRTNPDEQDQLAHSSEQFSIRFFEYNWALNTI